LLNFILYLIILQNFVYISAPFAPQSELEQHICSVVALACVLSVGKQYDTFVALRNKLSTSIRLSATVAADVIEHIAQHGKQLLLAAAASSNNNINNIDTLLGSLITEIVATSCNMLSQVHELTALQALLKLVAKVATNHVSLFKPRFNEIVDLLVGIYLDRTIPETFREAISTMGFNALRTLWITNGEFTTGLLDKFMTDMKAIRPHDEQEYIIFVKYVTTKNKTKTTF